MREDRQTPVDGKIVNLQILQGFLLKGETCAHLSLPVIAIHNHSPGAVIQLDGTATGCINLLEEGAVSLGNILNQLARTLLWPPVLPT